MNRQQRSLLIALCAMLVIVGAVILVVTLSRGGDQTVLSTMPPLTATAYAPAETVQPEQLATNQPLSEEEMAQQAMLEEADIAEETAPPYVEPID